jgi:hypothetical protein
MFVQSCGVWMRLATHNCEAAILSKYCNETVSCEALSGRWKS